MKMQEDPKVEFVEDLWVQCDAPSCRKWRRLPAGTVVDDHVRWYCRMNPDTRYNACDIEEEHYDERNEILLTAAKAEPKPKGRHRSKRRKQDAKTEPAEKAISPKAELQKRQQWCEKKLKALAESLERVAWTNEDQQYLHVHAPEGAKRVLECLDLSSALAYFTQVIHEPLYQRQATDDLDSSRCADSG